MVTFFTLTPDSLKKAINLKKLLSPGKHHDSPANPDGTPTNNAEKNVHEYLPLGQCELHPNKFP